ncbi:MAG: hypothetical protein K8R37_04390 [Bacteroidales bacterium]|nr:hypothetical protein [Bacteroidales bacterium]
MSDVKQIIHKGKTIFLADNIGSQEDEVIATQERMLEMVKKAGNPNVLTLTDMTGVFTTRKVHKEMSRIGKELMSLSKKAAIVGMAKGPKKILISAFMELTRQPMKLFDNVEDAKEWLTDD